MFTFITVTRESRRVRNGEILTSYELDSDEEIVLGIPFLPYHPPPPPAAAAQQRTPESSLRRRHCQGSRGTPPAIYEGVTRGSKDVMENDLLQRLGSPACAAKLSLF